MISCDALTLPLDRIAVIEASAGTGKTYTITSVVLRLLLESKLQIEQILVVTYTRAATAELRDRVRRRLTLALRHFQGERTEDVEVGALYAMARSNNSLHDATERLDRALANLDEAPILTIHGFCQRVLSDLAFDSGASFDATLANDEGALLEEIATDYFAKELSFGEEEEVRVLRELVPERLRKLATRASGNPHLLPEVEDIALDTGPWRAQREICAEIWHAERAAICEVVSSLKSTKQFLGGWTVKMDRLMAGAAPGLARDDFVKGFSAFTLEGYNSKASKDSRFVHRFMAEAQRLLELDQVHARAERNAKVRFQRNFLTYVEHEKKTRERERNQRTFDALLRDLDHAVHSERGPALCSLLRTRFRAALVDEFQDTDPVQYGIFKSVFGAPGHALLLIGDPKQAIYGFRGADVFAYLRAREDAAGHVYTLDVNRRSDAELVGALNALYVRVSAPFATDGIDYHPVRVPEAARERFRAQDSKAPVELLLCDSELSSEALRNEITRNVASEIARLLSSGATRRDDQPGKEPRQRALSARDIAVLCRKNDEAKLMQRKLSELSVPSVLQGDSSVFDSEDATELERVLLALAHPTDARALRSMLCSMYAGLDALELVSLEADDAAWDEHRARIHTLSESMSSRGFAQTMRHWAQLYEVEHHLLRRPDGPRRITNLWHLLELLSDVATSERLHALGILRALRSLRTDASLRSELVGEAQELRLESSDNAVVLTTIHKSKGLEYPVVFVPFAWDGTLLRNDDAKLVRFHDEAQGHALTLDLGSDALGEHKAVAEDEALAENLRLVYVALTRAKHRVSLVVPTTRGKKFESSALCYLLAGGGPRVEVSERWKKATPDQVSDALSRLAQELEGKVSVSRLRAHELPARPLAGALDRKLQARSFQRAFRSVERTASFSSLIAGKKLQGAERAADRDAFGDDDTASEQASRLVLDGFPRGALAGQLIHEVLEHHDFTADKASLDAQVDKSVLTRGYAASLSPMLARGLHDALRTPLDASGLSLSVLTNARRVNEMEFLFPVREELTPHRLERTFRVHAAPATQAACMLSLRTLSFEALRGYLRGYIDLVFEHEGRFFIADYKSNHLGPRPEDYAPSALVAEMVKHQYYLQYHLYTLALHRHLKQRQRDYSYERHLGGVFYLFLRGMAPEHALGTGVFFDLPARDLVEELDRLVGSLDGQSPP